MAQPCRSSEMPCVPALPQVHRTLPSRRHLRQTRARFLEVARTLTTEGDATRTRQRCEEFANIRCASQSFGCLMSRGKRVRRARGGSTREADGNGYGRRRLRRDCEALAAPRIRNWLGSVTGTTVAAHLLFEPAGGQQTPQTLCEGLTSGKEEYQNADGLSDDRTIGRGRRLRRRAWWWCGCGGGVDAPVCGRSHSGTVFWNGWDATGAEMGETISLSAR